MTKNGGCGESPAQNKKKPPDLRILRTSPAVFLHILLRIRQTCRAFTPLGIHVKLLLIVDDFFHFWFADSFDVCTEARQFLMEINISAVKVF